MWVWLKARWLSMLGALGFLEPAWRFIKWALDWQGRADSAGSMWTFLIDPPGWFPLASALVGVALIWWDFHRRTKAAPRATYPVGIEEGAHAADTEDATVKSPAKPRRWQLVVTGTDLIIAPLVVGFGIFVWLFILSPSKPEVAAIKPEMRGAVDVPPKIEAAPKAENTKPAPVREFVNFNFNTLTKKLEGLNGIQAQKIKDSYIGKWVRVAGRIRDVRPYGTSAPQLISVTFLEPTDVGGNTSLSFRPNWSARLSFVNREDSLSAECQIADFYPDGLSLTECQIE